MPPSRETQVDSPKNRASRKAGDKGTVRVGAGATNVSLCGSLLSRGPAENKELDFFRGGEYYRRILLVIVYG